MKATKYSVLAGLLFVIFAAPSTVRADSIVAVTISNLSFPCFSVVYVPPPCFQTLDAFFLWDNTLDSYVGGSLFFSTSGPLGSAFSATPYGSGFYLSTLPGNPVSAQIDFFMGSTSPGPYSLATSLGSVAPGTVFSDLICQNIACTSTTPFYGTQNLGVGNALFKGAIASAGSVNVFALPVAEPSSAALLGSGLLFLIGVLPVVRRRPV